MKIGLVSIQIKLMIIVTDSNGCSDTSVLNLISESDMYIVEESIDLVVKVFAMVLQI